MPRLSEEEVGKISEVTEGFSFADLKELFLPSKMRWIANPQQDTMAQVMTEQASKLYEQMASTSTYAEHETSEGQAEMQPGSGFMRGGTFYRARRLPG